MRKYRVWTKDFRSSPTCHTQFTTLAKCKKFILSRWGFWPGFAYISQAKDRETFTRYNGE